MRAPKPEVLVVYEDLRHCCAVLRQEGYDPTCLFSFAEGANRLGREAFDLVILSQGRPDLDGQIVLARRGERGRPRLVLVLARSVDMNCHLEARQLGAIDYLKGPVPPVANREASGHASSLRPRAAWTGRDPRRKECGPFFFA